MEKEKGRGKGRVEKVYNRQQKVKEKMSNEEGVVLRGKWEGGKRGYILWQFLAINFLKSLTALVQNRGKDHFGHFLKHKGPKWKF